MYDNQGTLLSVTLDQLRAFELDPRITRNPNYDEIKASIKNRGLDHPPQITQRPGESHYIIFNGGNTRLAILNELWLETQDKVFWDITCLFHTWLSGPVERGNLQCLLGHLVENDLRGSLTFIEKSLAVQKAADICLSLYGAMSQAELLQKLDQSGYAVHQSVYSRMMATINFLLPHIPDLLYSGLPKTTIERLLMLRACTLKFWDSQCQSIANKPDFDDVFAMALIPFNGPLAGFSYEGIRDELTGLISQALEIDYNAVALITDAGAQKRQTLLGSPSPTLPEINEQRRYQPEAKTPQTPIIQNTVDNIKKQDGALIDTDSTIGQEQPDAGKIHTTIKTEQGSEDAANTDPQTIRFPVRPDAEWLIDPVFDTTDNLPSLAEQTAWELAAKASLEHLIQPSQENGFDLAEPDSSLSNEARTYWQLLSFLAKKMGGGASLWQHLFLGSAMTPAGFGDDVVMNIFQLIRLLRRLHEKQREETQS
ncbi:MULTISPECIES: ParB family protein [Lonsdalea]|uniref:Uncharacterized protein n=2 Tax=Lonsdalea TaxID=1082702 RepID=A0ACD1J949_9GAMM|nr:MULTISPECIES: ParB family protein [Lonsdalea]RAT11154.1 hypothetical protein AU485_14995 [Lonsdalea quercina]RAT18976.1 hypothetical protein AU487_12745 [Lonsdalea populi]RAT21482.1 hypothetical protein AU488_12675 [Lonsdalea populi]RAT30844.1 hypothetical protein AU492_16135 [Lonsdalea populi]RAT33201.1 hypothetical protein AU493_15115 [Lonsdalea populi]